MKFIYRLILLLFLSDVNAVNIKVLLSEFSDNFFSLDISSPAGIKVKSFSNPNKQSQVNDDLRVICKDGFIYLNGKRLAADTQLIFEPADKTFINYNGSMYKGHVILMKHKNGYILINRLDLEDYVYAVLKTESWPTWPIPAHMVMAVACRSYAVATMKESKRAGLPYHIKPSNYHQTYSGHHESSDLRSAVDNTSGLIMTYDKQPVLAMFDTCCGGVIPAKIKNMSYPPLLRYQKCNYCKDFKVFNWTFEVAVVSLLENLKTHLKALKNITEIKVHTNDKAGLVDKIMVRDGRKVFYIEGKRIYSLFKEIKSYCFEISHDRKNSKIIFNGQGFGHHVGLCQWGAYQMTKEGFAYKDILRFFYPKIEFMKIV